MVFVFSVTEKNNKYKLLDENINSKIELIKVHNDDCEMSQPVINNNIDHETIDKDENKVPSKKPRKKKLTKKNKEFVDYLIGKNVTGSGFKTIPPYTENNKIFL